MAVNAGDGIRVTIERPDQPPIVIMPDILQVEDQRKRLVDVSNEPWPKVFHYRTVVVTICDRPD